MIEKEENAPEEITETDNQDKHRLKKTYKYTDADKSKDQQVNLEEKLLDGFKWQGKIKEEGIESQPDLSLETITEGITAIIDYIVKHMSVNDYEEMSWSMRVKVPCVIHLIVEERFNDRWNLESRFEQFDRVKSAFDDVCLHSDVKYKIDAKLQEIFPSVGKIGVIEEGDERREQFTQTPVGEWEFVNAVIDDEDDLIVGIVGEEPEVSDDCIFVTLEIAKSAIKKDG